MIGETDTRREDMANTIYFIAEDFAIGNPVTIYFRRGVQTQIPVIDVIESADGIYHLALINSIPRFPLFDERGVVGETECGVNVDIAKHHKISSNGDGMTHVILPVFGKTGVQQFILLRVDGVVEITRVTHGDFLVPAIIAHLLLTLEWIEA